MGRNKKVCVLIDAYGSAQAFPQAFNERGFDCLHIRTSPALEPLYKGRFDATAYLECIEYDGDRGRVIERLQRYSLQCILPGMEPGVELADFLSEHFGLLTNGTRNSTARRDKFLMAKTLAGNNLNVIPYYKSGNVEDLIRWGQENCDWPVVIKPLNSAGIEGLQVCNNKQEIREAFLKNIGKVNLMGGVNRELLIQPFIQADEYVVNHVSYQGKHFLTDIWQNNKRYIPGVGIIYERENLLEFDGPIQKELDEYVRQVLDTLEIQNGPSHAEVKYTPHGPCLLEVAARVTGAVSREIYQECFGHNPVDLTVEVYTNPQKFLDHIKIAQKIRKQAVLVFLASRKEGMIKDIPLEKTLGTLKSLRQANFKVKRGDLLKKTTDLNSSSAFIYLVHGQKEIIEQDYQVISANADSGFVLENSSGTQSPPS